MASKPRAKKTKKVFDIPKASAIGGKRNATQAFVSHSISTQNPTAKLRIFRGNISDSNNHTKGPIVPCMLKTKPIINIIIQYALNIPSGNKAADKPTNK